MGSHLGRALVQVEGHLHAALVEEAELAEEQGQLPQVLLQLAEAVLVHGLALGHAVRELAPQNTPTVHILCLRSWPGSDWAKPTVVRPNQKLAGAWFRGVTTSEKQATVCSCSEITMATDFFESPFLPAL